MATADEIRAFIAADPEQQKLLAAERKRVINQEASERRAQWDAEAAMGRARWDALAEHTRRFDLFASEMRDFALRQDRSHSRIVDRLSDIELTLIRVTNKSDRHEARIDDHDQQLGDIRRRLETLESAPVTKGT